MLASISKYRMYRLYSTQFLSYIKKLGLSQTKAEGEDEYLTKWRQLTDRIEPWSYRLFSHYCGQTPYIVPEDVGHTILEARLNPIRFRPFYSDKNIYDTYVPEGATPRAIVRRMGGGKFLNERYQPLDAPLSELLRNYTKVILKPSIDSDSGRGVMLFTRNGEQWCAHNNENVILDEQFLSGYGQNFILQEALTQHPDIAKYNPTSINTLRVATYRSVVDEKVHVIASVMRIGKNGAFVDNAHGGGRFIGIDIKTGKLGKIVSDQYGNQSPTWNGYDFSATDNVVPSWPDVVEFVTEVASRIHHLRLIAFDISVDTAGCPRLVELNVDGFSFWLFMFTNQLPLGPYTDEIIAHCKMPSANPVKISIQYD